MGQQVTCVKFKKKKKKRKAFTALKDTKNFSNDRHIRYSLNITFLGLHSSLLATVQKNPLYNHAI